MHLILSMDTGHYPAVVSFSDFGEKKLMSQIIRGQQII